MDANEAAKHLATIRRIMESATQYTVLPGRAAICGGLLVLVGCGVTYGLMGSLDFKAVSQMAAGRRGALIGMWVGIALAAVAQDIVWTLHLARRRGRNPWSRLAQLASCAVGPSIAAGCMLSVALGWRGEWQLLPGTWMMLYGAALWMVGTLSVRAPRALGLIFFLAGVVTLFWAAVALVVLALTFGMAHILFGIYLMSRFGE
jgi:hypothetical protein